MQGLHDVSEKILHNLVIIISMPERLTAVFLCSYIFFFSFLYLPEEVSCFSPAYV